MTICVKELVYALVIMIGQCNFGAIMCYCSPTSNEIQTLHHLKQDSIEWSLYNSISSLFAITGSFITSGLLKCFRNSRKKSIFVITIFAMAFWFLNCLTKINIWAGVATRALLGIAMGSFSTIGPLYLVEIAPPGLSGFFGSLNQLGIVIGLLLFDFIGPSLTYLELNYVGAGISALEAILIWFIKESPAVEALNILDKEKESQPEEKESLCQKNNLIGIFSGIFIMVLQQFCGINAILTNIASIMNNSGLDMNGSYQGGIATCAQLLAVFISALIIDKIGRKVTWIISASIIVASLLVFALNTKYDWLEILPLICIFCFQFGYGLGMGPIPGFLIPEYFSDKVRATATAITTASNWLFTFATIFIWPLMNVGLGLFGSYLFFMGVAVVAIIFGALFIHEIKTDGIEQEEDEKSKPDVLKEFII